MQDRPPQPKCRKNKVGYTAPALRIVGQGQYCKKCPQFKNVTDRRTNHVEARVRDSRNKEGREKTNMKETERERKKEREKERKKEGKKERKKERKKDKKKIKRKTNKKTILEKRIEI